MEAFDPFAGEARPITFEKIGLGLYLFAELDKPKMARIEALADQAKAAKVAADAASDGDTRIDPDDGVRSVADQIELMLSKPDGSPADGLADLLMAKWDAGEVSLQYLVRAQAKLAEWAGLEESGNA